MTINRAQFFQLIAGAIAGLFGIKKATAGPAIPLRPTGAYGTFERIAKEAKDTAGLNSAMFGGHRIYEDPFAPPNQITLFNPENFKGMEIDRISIDEAGPIPATIMFCNPSGGNDWVKDRYLGYNNPILHEGDRLSIDFDSKPILRVVGS